MMWNGTGNKNGNANVEPYGFRFGGDPEEEERPGPAQPGGQSAPAIPAPAAAALDGAGELDRAVRLAVGDGCEADWSAAMACLARAEAAGITDARSTFKRRCADYEAAELARLKRGALEQGQLAAQQMEEKLSRCSEPPAVSPPWSGPGAKGAVSNAAGIAGMILSAVGLVLVLGLAFGGLGALFPNSPLTGFSRILTGWLPLGGLLARLSPGMIFVGAEFALQASPNGRPRAVLRRLPPVAVALFLIWAVIGRLGRGRLIFGLLRAVFWAGVNVAAYAAVLISVQRRAAMDL